MSGIAKILLNRGYKVSGSDIKNNEQIKILKNLGAEIYIGHRPDNLENVDVVVYTNAVKRDNIELQTARTKDIKIFKRAEFISQMFKDKKTIAVTGTHGKTTTTSMLATIFVNANRDPSVMVGGNLDIIDGNIKNGRGDIFITEADESDGSFTFFNPNYAVLTNIEWDHFNYYKNKGDLIYKFIEFINKIPQAGSLAVWGGVIEEYPQLEKYHDNISTYGFKNENYTARNIKLLSYVSRFDLHSDNKKIGTVQLQVPGLHNILNALAAFVISKEAGLSTEKIIEGLKKYKGVRRRFERKGEFKGALIIDDYAHHPTEIVNTIKTARGTNLKKLYVVFQPHRYSRTQNLMEEFSESFDEVDELILTDIYSASEKPIEGVSSKKLYKMIKNHKENNDLDFKVSYIKDFDKIEDYLKHILQKDDLLITIGAGNVYKIGEKLAGGNND